MKWRALDGRTKWMLGGLAGWAAWRLVRRASYSLAGRTVFITGGSRGLGLVLARQLLDQGARVALSARSAEELDAARGQLSAEVRTYVCDLSDREAVEQVIRRATEELGGIDVLINNAGLIQVGPEESMTLRDYETEMGVHFWGPLYAIRAVLPKMRMRKEGRIVNIASIGGKISVPHLLPYSASKFALVGLSEGLTAELAKDGIRVTTVCPGLMRTGSPRNAKMKGNHRAEYAWFKLADSLPPLAMSAERAAAQIISALRRGDAEVILSMPAKIASRVHGLFPGATARALGWVNRALPRAREETASRRGFESTSAVSESPLTALSDRAARRNNQV
jgi:short-subunit dehydrogenase